MFWLCILYYTLVILYYTIYVFTQVTNGQYSLQADKCVDCGEVCIPAYGVTRVDGRRPLLVPTGRDCFWLSSASSPVGKPFVNNPNSGDSYIYGFGGGSFPNQQRAQMDTAALRPFVQQVQQSGPWIYQNQQPYPNFYRPSAGSNFGPAGGFAMTRTK